MKRLKHHQREQVIELAELMIPVTDIAQRYGISTRTVRRILHDAGVKPPKIPSPPSLTDAQVHCAKLCYAGGDTIHELAKDYGLSVTAMYFTLKRAGVHFRPRGPKRKFDDAALESVHRMRRSGRTLKEISESVGGVAISTVYRALGRVVG